ncbi:LOW QUALITY PROTEIN: pyruvate carboxyl transferase [Geomicrobium sp. JCM 19038]|nr:LOW QUALITY PROTEIN: pyruvate carboxyl transferase [Geomicrobium sp. JCM 19038]
MSKLKTISKVLVANRGEIAIRIFRACTELEIRTVAVYSKEDSGAFHRYKADEPYLIGEDKKPIEAYLDIEAMIKLAKRIGVDAIHPGYGFLAENTEFAKRCEQEGIVFIGPKSEHLEMFGDKIRARTAAINANIPVIPGSDGAVLSLDEVEAFASEHGYPLIIKASLGGGGRGMRIVREAKELKESYERAKSEALSAFGNDEVYVEKLIENPKHIEVQILGDHSENILHLYERDCSVQRRHQKVVEIAPSINLEDELRERICESAVQLAKSVNYYNAGTVEFLVGADGEFYFIEVNPRIQVEHTITEMVTGVDIVHAQLYIADGATLFGKELALPKQDQVTLHGFAIQSRVTTEDPENGFMPDTGRINAYRSSGGFGVRLDAGNGFQGAVISAHYDSLLVKVSTWATTFEVAAQKMLRNLREFRIRGIKTNISFLENVVTHPSFLNGEYNTSFIDQTPELFVFPRKKDRGTKMLTFIGETIVNGYPDLEKQKKPIYLAPRIPEVDLTKTPKAGTKQRLDELGADGFVEWLKKEERTLITDTTYRDAHQSLLATRVRTHDLKAIADQTARLMPDLFSLELWGGATYDVSMRFLHEDPWERLVTLREKIPNVMFQMLLRGANAVGYKNYPDNVIEEFVKRSAEAGIDVFRVFDSLNWLEGMKPAIKAVRESGKLAEAAICYSGDLLEGKQTKYNLDYYLNLAKELEREGAHILAIKDMAGLLKPEAAFELIGELKSATSLPIHLHMHDTSGNGYLRIAGAIDAGVDVVDTAISSMAGSTSQPSMESLYYALKGTNKEPQMNVTDVKRLTGYWEDVRHYYKGFENGLLAPHPEIYEHEMPGGQYSNLQQQAKAVGLKNQWDHVKDMYKRVNEMFGDIVKVTPSSKVVGDMALYMVKNELTEEDIFEKGESLDFPESVIELFRGEIGQPHGGFPEELQKIILKNREPLKDRPGKHMDPVDFEQVEKELFESLEREVTAHDVLNHTMYPKVFEEFEQFRNRFGDVSVLDTGTFFYGLRLGEEIEVVIEEGKTLIVKLISVSEPNEKADRIVYYELNGQPREVVIKDRSIKTNVREKAKADKKNPAHIAATMPGTILNVIVKEGEDVKKGDHLIITEAMKMETTVQAPKDGRIKSVHISNNEAIEAGDLLLEFES